VLLSLSTACFYLLPLRIVFRLAAEAGFDGVELVMAPEVWLRGPRYVQALAREYGLSVCSVHQALMSGGSHGSDAGRMGDALSTALDLGCPCVVVHDPGVIRWGDPKAQRWLSRIGACQEHGRGSGVRLALENPGVYRESDLCNLLGRPVVLADFARRHDLDITLDTCHAGTTSMPLSETYSWLKGRLANVHLSDLKRLRPTVDQHFLYNLSSHHQVPGEGFLRLDQFLSQLARDGFRGPVTLETSFVAMRAWSQRQCVDTLRCIAEYVHDAAGKGGVKA